MKTDDVFPVGLCLLLERVPDLRGICVKWGTLQANEHFQGWRVDQSTNPSTLTCIFFLVFPRVSYVFLVFLSFS